MSQRERPMRPIISDNLEVASSLWEGMDAGSRDIV